MFMRFLGVGPGHRPLLVAIGDKFQDAWLAFTGNPRDLAESADADVDHEELPTTLFQDVQPSGLADNVIGGNEVGNEESYGADLSSGRTDVVPLAEADVDDLEQELEGLEVGGDYDDDISRL
jgi:hypothetical protein